MFIFMTYQQSNKRNNMTSIIDENCQQTKDDRDALSNIYSTSERDTKELEIQNEDQSEYEADNEQGNQGEVLKNSERECSYSSEQKNTTESTGKSNCANNDKKDKRRGQRFWDYFPPIPTSFPSYRGWEYIWPTNLKEVQVLVPVQTLTTKDFTCVIRRIFKELSFKCKLCNAYKHISKQSPLVVVCQISSRFEPDIDLALNGIKQEERFVVIILHTDLKGNLPVLPTGSKIAYKEKYKNIEFIDIAYNRNDELYDCQMNTNARDLLKSFCTNFYKQQ